MNSFLAPQIEYLLFLQNLREITGGTFEQFFMFITSLGEITLPVLFIAFIYWCISKKDCTYILFSWGIGVIFTQFLKLWACIYRPWILDSRVKPIPEAIKWAGGYSFPSGHTQTAVCVWGGAAVCSKSNFIKIALIVVALLIGFSRHYIGVHTPQDVIVSIVVGCLLLFFMHKLLKWVDGGKNRDVIILASVYLLCIALMLYGYFKSYPIDYFNGKILVDPIKMKMYSLPKVGMVTGIFTGWFLERRFVDFVPEIGSINEKFARFIIGALILVGITSALDFILPNLVDKKSTMAISAFVSAIFVTVVYPFMIKMFAKRKQKAE